MSIHGTSPTYIVIFSFTTDLAGVSYDEAALFHDDLGGALGVDPEPAGGQGDDCAHGFSGGVEGVHFLELGVRHLTPQLNKVVKDFFRMTKKKKKYPLLLGKTHKYK